MLDMTTCQPVSLSYLRNVFICLFSFLFQLPFNTHNPHCTCSSCLQIHREQERKKLALLFVKHAHTHTKKLHGNKYNKGTGRKGFAQGLLLQGHGLFFTRYKQLYKCCKISIVYNNTKTYQKVKQYFVNI